MDSEEEWVNAHASAVTFLLSSKSALFPARAVTIFGLPASKIVKFLMGQHSKYSHALKETHSRSEKNIMRNLTLFLKLLNPFLCPGKWILKCKENFRPNFWHKATQVISKFGGNWSYRAGYVIHDDGRRSAPVVHGSQAVVPLLPSCVPNFKLNGGIVHGQRLREERRPNGWLLRKKRKTI